MTNENIYLPYRIIIANPAGGAIEMRENDIEYIIEPDSESPFWEITLKDQTLITVSAMTSLIIFSIPEPEVKIDGSEKVVNISGRKAVGAKKENKNDN